MTGGKEDDEQDLTSRYELDSAILQTDNSVNTGRDFKFKALKESSNTFHKERGFSYITSTGIGENKMESDAMRQIAAQNGMISSNGTS